MSRIFLYISIGLAFLSPVDSVAELEDGDTVEFQGPDKSTGDQTTFLNPGRTAESGLYYDIDGTTKTYTSLTYGPAAVLQVTQSGQKYEWWALPRDEGVTSITYSVESISYKDKSHVWVVSLTRQFARIALINILNGEAERLYDAFGYAFNSSKRWVAYSPGGHSVFIDDVLIHPEVMGGFTTHTAFGPALTSGETVDDVTSAPEKGWAATLAGRIHWTSETQVLALLEKYPYDPSLEEQPRTSSTIFSFVKGDILRARSGAMITSRINRYLIPTNSTIHELIGADDWYTTIPLLLEQDAEQTTQSTGTASTNY